jgi:hypothetical protein
MYSILKVSPDIETSKTVYNGDRGCLCSFSHRKASTPLLYSAQIVSQLLPQFTPEGLSGGILATCIVMGRLTARNGLGGEFSRTSKFTLGLLTRICSSSFWNAFMESATLRPRYCVELVTASDTTGFSWTYHIVCPQEHQHNVHRL